MKPITATNVKAVSLSSDGTQVSFSLVTDTGDIAVTMPASCLAAFRNPQRPASGGRAATTTQGTLHRPKKWVLGAETTKHKVVALIFDPQTSHETGFALSPKSAKELAGGLVRSAEAVATYKAPKPN